MGQPGFFENLMLYGYGWRAARAFVWPVCRAAPSAALGQRHASLPHPTFWDLLNPWWQGYSTAQRVGI